MSFNYIYTQIPTCSITGPQVYWKSTRTFRRYKAKITLDSRQGTVVKFSQEPHWEPSFIRNTASLFVGVII